MPQTVMAQEGLLGHLDRDRKQPQISSRERPMEKWWCFSSGFRNPFRRFGRGVMVNVNSLLLEKKIKAQLCNIL